MGTVRKNSHWYMLALLSVGTLFVWYAVIIETQGGKLHVSFLDVGQGDAIFITAPNGNQVLVDAGPDKQTLRVLSRVMPFYDRSIDAVVVSHPDQDHIGGLPDILNRYAVNTVVESGVSSESSTYKDVEKKIADGGIETVTARRGMRINMGSGAIIHVLFPDRNPQGWDTNDASIVAQLQFGNTSVMLTGDSPQTIESYLVSIDGKKLKSDILKAGHHGSRTSSDELFVGFISPAYAVISVGKNNKYGHPNKEILDLFANLSVQTLRTDELGTISFSSDGTNFTRD